MQIVSCDLLLVSSHVTKPYSISMITEIWAQQAEVLTAWHYSLLLQFTVFAQTQKYYVLGRDVFQLRLARFFVFNTGKITLRSYEHVILGTFSIFIPCTNLRGMEVALSSERWETTSVWKFCVSSLYIIVWWSNIKDHSEVMLLWSF